MNKDFVLLMSSIVLIVGSVFGAIVYHSHTKYECVKFAIEKNIPSSEAKSLCDIITWLIWHQSTLQC